ncbi:unnamed protein product, partial [Didymodactylos carnosus]
KAKLSPDSSHIIDKEEKPQKATSDLIQHEQSKDESVHIQSVSDSDSQQSIFESNRDIQARDKEEKQQETIIDRLQQAANDTVQKVIDNIPSFYSSPDQEKTKLAKDVETAEEAQKSTIEVEPNDQSELLKQSDVHVETVTDSDSSEQQPSIFESVRQTITAPLTAVSNTVQKVVDNLRPSSDIDEQTPSLQKSAEENDQAKSSQISSSIEEKSVVEDKSEAQQQ